MVTNYDWIQYYKKLALERQQEICDLIMRNCKLEIELEEARQQLAATEKYFKDERAREWEEHGVDNDLSLHVRG